MKRLFLSMAFYRMATEGEGGSNEQPTVTEKVYTSDKLTALDAEEVAAWENFAKLKPMSKDANAAMLAIFKIQKQKEAEIANLKQVENEAKIAELRNARLAMFDDTIKAYDEVVAINAKKGATVEEKNAVYDVYKNLAEKVKNELLGKYANVAKVVAKADGTAAAPKGATSTEIKQHLLDFIAEGKTSTEAVKLTIELGFSRGTTGAVRTAMVKAGEIVE